MLTSALPSKNDFSLSKRNNDEIEAGDNLIFLNDYKTEDETSPIKPSDLKLPRLKVSVETESKEKLANRCDHSGCSRKLNLAQQVANKCLCGHIYCDKHRGAEYHDCDFDHHQRGQNKIRAENPTVSASKVERF